MPVDTPKRELLYSWSAAMFRVLVPKQRGQGFLRVPYGHHPKPELDRIAEVAGCDVWGLDGALDFEVPGSLYHGGKEARDAFVARIVPLLEVHYGVTAREISSDEQFNLIEAGTARFLATRV